MSTANKEFVPRDTTSDDVPEGGDTVDNSYSTQNNAQVPVITDETPVEQPNDQGNPDSDGRLSMSRISPAESSILMRNG